MSKTKLLKLFLGKFWKTSFFNLKKKFFLSFSRYLLRDYLFLLWIRLISLKLKVVKGVSTRSPPPIFDSTSGKKAYKQVIRAHKKFVPKRTNRFTAMVKNAKITLIMGCDQEGSTTWFDFWSSDNLFSLNYTLQFEFWP